MYYPYLRGKQYELLALRESVETLKNNKFCPIIEPVKKSTSGLIKCLEKLSENEIKVNLIVNPVNGDLKSHQVNQALKEILEDKNDKSNYIIPSFYIENEIKLDDIKSFLECFKNREVALIHFDYQRGKDLAELVKDYSNISTHIFFEGTSSRKYQRYFKGEKNQTIIISDGFEKRKRNLDHPEDEHFSDMHLEFKDLSYDGFGDFLMVGDQYSESGGPAYTVAIHMTYLDDEDDMRIKHFKSDPSDSYADPAGKFMEALTKFHKEVESGEFPSNTGSSKELIELFERKHFPGLGFVKKISMKHHIELMGNFFSSK